MNDLISKEVLLRTMADQCSNNCSCCSYFECGHCELIALAPVVPAIVIPPQPTNKKMIRRVFGKKVTRMMERFAWVHYQSKWFNAPYKKEEE